jgi:hypothetical protein
MHQRVSERCNNPSLYQSAFEEDEERAGPGVASVGAMDAISSGDAAPLSMKRALIAGVGMRQDSSGKS